MIRVEGNFYTAVNTSLTEGSVLHNSRFYAVDQSLHCYADRL